MTQNAHQMLEQHRDAARQAEARRDEVRLERDRARRGAEEAEAALAAYFSELERGEKSDPPREKALKVALSKARDSAGVEWDARARAAAERVTEAEAEIREYVAGHVDALAAELVEEAVEARDRLMEAVDGLNQAEGRWNTIRSRWSPLLEHRNISPAELPPSPLAGATGLLAESLAPLHSGVPRHPSRLLPIPWSLLPEDERPEQSPAAPVEEDGLVRGPPLLDMERARAA
jgi:chemotaxis protein histidine kinase CheA